jgi:hypothetical protein
VTAVDDFPAKFDAKSFLAHPGPHACWRLLRRVCVIWAIIAPGRGRMVVTSSGRCHRLRKESAMETRATSRHVSFRKSFTLRGVTAIQPAGRYVVRSEQELLDTVTCLGWRQTSLTIEIFQDGATEHVAIEAQDLREALVRDADPASGPPPLVAPDRTRRRRDLMRRGGRS